VVTTAGLNPLTKSPWSSRKYANVTRNGRVALVIGWDDEQTVQLEGMAEEIQDPAQDPAVATQSYAGLSPIDSRNASTPSTTSSCSPRTKSSGRRTSICSSASSPSRRFRRRTPFSR
jgi:hypothetical protein